MSHLAGRSHNEYLRADREGRVTPLMQEQDPRRDVLGAIGTTKERCDTSRKNRNQPSAFVTNSPAGHHGTAVGDKGTHLPLRKQEKRYLTPSTLSEMSNRRDFEMVAKLGGVIPRCDFGGQTEFRV